MSRSTRRNSANPRFRGSAGLQACPVETMKRICSLVVLAVAAIAAQTRTPPATVNWPLHNLDLAGSRYSPLDQIDRSNVKSLVPRWLFQHGVIDGVSNQTTPVIV